MLKNKKLKQKITKEINTQSGKLRKGTYGVYFIISKIKKALNSKKGFIILDGDKIDVKRNKYRLFLKSIKCVKCGIKGSYFAKERDKVNDQYHLNLYALKSGQEMMMTKDHIKPKAWQGRNNLENYQVMCEKCNVKKGSKLQVGNSSSEIPFNHMVDIREGYLKELINKLQILRKGIQKKKPDSLKREIKFGLKIDKNHKINDILIEYVDVVEEYQLVGLKKLHRLKINIKDLSGD